MAHRRSFVAALCLGLTLALSAIVPAAAHHGWSWAESEQFELKGAIERISMAPPHPVLHVKATDGTLWQVDLGNPNQTARSGFTGTTAKVGDAVTIIGNRSLDRKEAHMKAVRVILAGQNYDMYPERLRQP